jgi:phosphopentomutase
LKVDLTKQSGLATVKFDRIILIVLDSVGIGAMPDAGAWGDEGSDTLGHVAGWRALRIPNLVRLGIANIRSLPYQTAPSRPDGCYGRAALLSPGKDTTTGHWEMAGIILAQPFPIYRSGFPPDVIEGFEAAIGRKVLGNYPASGTEIIQELGEEHMKTGRPIVYTSADSVFQIAAHEDVIPVAELYRMCEIARKQLDGPHRVGRVIARPFVGVPGNFKRTERRKDYAIDPPEPTVMDRLMEKGISTFGVGKIHDIFCGHGLAGYVKTKGNADGIEKTIEAMGKQPAGLIFTNLVDFDMLYGHRNDLEGYARALEESDEGLGRVIALLQQSDLLLLTADHGCDPGYPGTDHTREYAPVLAYGRRAKCGVNLGTRESLADVAQTIADSFGLRMAAGRSFLSEISSSQEGTIDLNQ